MKKDYLTPDIHVMSIESGAVLMQSEQVDQESTVSFENLVNGGDFAW